MRLNSTIGAVVSTVLLCAASPCLSGGSLYIGHEPEHHVLASKYVDQQYEITVLLPFSKADGSERFPVLYMPDADLFQGLVQGATPLMQVGDVHRFIIVAIGYPEIKHGLQSVILRLRDLTPTRVMAVDQMEVGRPPAPYFLRF